MDHLVFREDEQAVEKGEETDEAKQTAGGDEKGGAISGKRAEKPTY